MFRSSLVFLRSSQPSRSSWRLVKSRLPRRNCSTLGPSSEKSELSLWQNVSICLDGVMTDIHHMNSVEETGAKSPIEPPTVTQETIATICYTSVRSPVYLCKPLLPILCSQGTTGNPKGAILTQGALASAAYSNTCGLEIGVSVEPVLLSFLPLAHIYGVCLTP
jgi:acyl-CoA synthetase (AMP-forming)/AMP-acid ligase II